MSRPRKSPTQTTTKLKKKNVVLKRSLPTRTTKKVRRVTPRTLPISEKRSVLSSRIKKRIGIFLVTIGVVLLTGPKILSVVFPEPAISQEPIMADSSFASTNKKEDFPTRVLIPSVKIDLPITFARLHRGYWETSETTASFGEGSASPGQKNNTVIFAHAKEHLFLPLKEVKAGDNIYLFTSDRYFSYTVDSITEVKPTDVYLVKKTDDERVTLFTCSGFLDSKRLVVIAKPLVESHEKAPQ